EISGIHRDSHSLTTMGDEPNEPHFRQRGELRPSSGKTETGLHALRDTASRLNLKHQVLIVIVRILLELNDGVSNDGEVLSCEFQRFRQMAEEGVTFAELADLIGERRFLNGQDGI